MSDNLNKDFEELIRNKLENYSTPVDSNIWGAIERSLIKRKRINYIRVVAGVAAAAVVFLVLAINLFKPENNSQ
ncbi:MAG: hypothetical protein LBR10_04270, partial [Prevotellaceae bacterium]|nr:hypothetical protein [Prevotellaceae bacterium]